MNKLDTFMEEKEIHWVKYTERGSKTGDELGT